MKSWGAESEGQLYTKALLKTSFSFSLSVLLTLPLCLPLPLSQSLSLLWISSSNFSSVPISCHLSNSISWPLSFPLSLSSLPSSLPPSLSLSISPLSLPPSLCLLPSLSSSFFLLVLQQCFSSVCMYWGEGRARGTILSPKGHLEMFGDSFGCYNVCVVWWGCY